MATEYNKESFAPDVAFGLLVSNVDPSQRSASYSTSDFLRTMFYKVRSEFATIINRMERSSEFDENQETSINKLKTVDGCVTKSTKAIKATGKKCMVVYGALFLAT